MACTNMRSSASLLIVAVASSLLAGCVARGDYVEPQLPDDQVAIVRAAEPTLRDEIHPLIGSWNIEILSVDGQRTDYEMVWAGGPSEVRLMPGRHRLWLDAERTDLMFGPSISYQVIEHDFEAGMTYVLVVRETGDGLYTIDLVEAPSG